MNTKPNESKENVQEMKKSLPSGGIQCEYARSSQNGQKYNLH